MLLIRKVLIFINLLFTILCLSQSMIGKTYDQVIDKFYKENLKPMHGVIIGNNEIKSLLLERNDYRVSYVFNENEICVRNIFIYKNEQSLKNDVKYFNENYEVLSKNKWISPKHTLCVELYQLGGSQNIKIEDCNVSNGFEHSHKTTNFSTNYMVKTDRAYFFTKPNLNDRKKAYLVYGEVINAISESKYFIYTEFINSKRIKTSGWILKEALIKN